MDDKIISMYSRGMSVREIRSHLEEIYEVNVSADLISTITDSVIDEVKKWQNRALQEVCVLPVDPRELKSNFL